MRSTWLVLGSLLVTVPATAEPIGPTGQLAVGATAGPELLGGVTAVVRAGVARAGRGAFVELGASRYAGVGPYTGGRTLHALAAAELTSAPAAWRRHLYLGVGLERFARDETEHQTGFAGTLVEPVAGLAVSRGVVRVDLAARLPLGALTATDGAAMSGPGELGPQVQLTVGAAWR